MTDSSRTREHLPCQVCGRSLATRPDGLVKPHKQRRGAEDNCRGAGYRHARWEVGQQLQHHSSGVWEVFDDVGGEYGDYWIRCLSGSEKGRNLMAHGEYMHRHGWTPVETPKAPDA